MGTVSLSSFEMQKLGFCTNFGYHVEVPHDDYNPMIKHFNNLNNPHFETCMCASFDAGCQRICFVIGESFCSDGSEKNYSKLFMVSACIKGLIEITGLGKVICCAPDAIVTHVRTTNNDPTGGLLVDKVTKTPITLEQVKQVNSMSRD